MDKSFATKCIHSGEMHLNGSVITPIFQSTTYFNLDQTNFSDFTYLRSNNTPNHLSLHKKLAELENGEDAIVMGSGLSAISITLLSFLKTGDHVLLQRGSYGGTISLAKNIFPQFGITFDFFNPNDPADWENKFKAQTKIIHIESMSNPMLEIPDFSAIVKFAKEKNIISTIDNTLTSPINFRPLDLGIDLSLHSATKYLNGHSDLVAGVAIGSKKLIDKIKFHLLHYGATLDPHACFLLQRGLKTLEVRMKAHHENAEAVSKYLEQHPKVKKVNYPGLKSNTEFIKAQKYFNGCGGLLSFEHTGSIEEAKKFVTNLKLFFHAPSLGGVESLVIYSGLSAKHFLSEEERLDIGMNEHIIRLSIGLESKDDLIQDLEQAFEK